MRPCIAAVTGVAIGGVRWSVQKLGFTGPGNGWDLNVYFSQYGDYNPYPTVLYGEPIIFAFFLSFWIFWVFLS